MCDPSASRLILPETSSNRLPVFFEVITSDVLPALSYVAFQKLSSSLHTINAFDDVPRSTSRPASRVGAPVSVLFRRRMLSSNTTVSAIADNVVPVTVRSPLIVTAESSIRMYDWLLLPWICTPPLI